MSRILVLLPTVLWLLWADVAHARQPAEPSPARVALFLGVLLLLVTIAAWAALVSARRRDREKEAGEMGLLPLIVRLAVPASLGWFTVGLFLLGWGEAASAVTGVSGIPELRTPGLFLATLPAYGTWALLLAAEYPLVRRRRESRLLVDLDQGRPIYPPPPMGSYWLTTLRQRLLFALVPLLLLMLVRDTAVLALWAANVQPSTRTEIWLFVLGALFVIAVSPELVRRLLPTFALPQGPLRERLEALCERTGLPMRDILVWNTDGTMVNAAVVGFLPRLRYVLLSDVLLDAMTPVQVEAVFAHEIGHVKHRHLLWYFIFLAGMTLFFAGPVEAAWQAMEGRFPVMLSLREPAEYVIGLGSLGLILVMFGLLSRCFERQADVFAARTMQAQVMSAARSMVTGDAPQQPALAGPVGPAGAEVFGSSLRQAARINQLPIDRRPAQVGPLAPLWWLVDQMAHFLHGTVNSRIEYLNDLARRPSQTYRFDVSITAVKAAVLALTVGSGSFLMW
jgi:STE24 endopeptidase